MCSSVLGHKLGDSLDFVLKITDFVLGCSHAPVPECPTGFTVYSF